MPLQVMTQQLRALPAKHGRFVRTPTTGLGSYNVAQALQAGKRPHWRLEGRWKMSIGVGSFLMVLGAILAFAVEATTPGININTLGIILLLTGLVAVLYSLLFWSNLSPWGRRRTVARRRTVVEERPVRVVEDRPVEVIEERPVEVIEERPLDDGLP
jgi:hypothetical protein